MAWKVTYRDKDSRRHTRMFDAASRKELFRLLEKNGIMPIKVEEATSKSARKLCKHGGVGLLGLVNKAFASLFFTKEIWEFGEWCHEKFLALEIKRRIAVALAFLAGAGSVAYICVFVIGRADSMEGNKVRRLSNSSSYIKTNGLASTSSDVAKPITPSAIQAGNASVTPPPPPKKDWQTLQREAMARKLRRKKEHEIVHNDSNVTDEIGRKPIHRNSTEHIMSMISTVTLGDMPYPLPTVPERDKQRMAQILLDKFEILPGDPDADEKQAINEVKDALGEYIRNGGDVDEFFSYYHRQLELAHRERMDAKKMVLEAAQSGDAELAMELLDKYNQNFEKKGIKTITLPQRVIEKKARKSR